MLLYTEYSNEIGKNNLNIRFRMSILQKILTFFSFIMTKVKMVMFTHTLFICGYSTTWNGVRFTGSHIVLWSDFSCHLSDTCQTDRCQVKTQAKLKATFSSRLICQVSRVECQQMEVLCQKVTINVFLRNLLSHRVQI